MFRNFITSINVNELIKMQSNQVTGRISKKEIKASYKNPTQSTQKSKIRKMGKLGK